jgi:DNA-binding CsgD family transcriptional regulator
MLLYSTSFPHNSTELGEGANTSMKNDEYQLQVASSGRGASNKLIARQLGISGHTANPLTDRRLYKIAHSRRAETFNLRHPKLTIYFFFYVLGCAHQR